MSNLLSQASLVMIPSGYKEDVVYSQIPTSGSGDLSFTRASNGTRVNSAGLVEVCPWNLVQQSETFNNAIWNKRSGVTITADSTTAPNGTTTADTANYSSGDGYIWQYLTLLPSTQYTISVYAKGSSGSIQFNAFWGTGTSVGSTITLTSDWQRLTFTFTTGSTTSVGDFGFFITATCNIWGAQLNIGSTAKPYFPTTDRLNVPRLTYQNGGGGCPSLLLEKQSTNLALWSEDFTQTAWVKTTGGSGAAPSVTANAGISPDGTQNADRVQFDCVGTTTSDRSILRQSISISNSTAYTFTFYVKAYSSGEIGKELNIRAENITGNPNITLTADWQRVSVSGTSSATSTLLIVETRGSVTANTTADILIWGAQLEASSYPTSYIQSTSSSATRVADACSKTGISSLIGQTEGVIFVDVNNQLVNPTSDTRIQLSDGTTDKWIFVGVPDGSIGGLVSVYVNNFATSFTMTFNSSVALSVGRFKVAFAYKSGDFRLYINGVSVGSSSATGTIPACSQLKIGGDTPTSTTKEIQQFNEVVIFPTRLTNAELASLTTI